MQEDEEILTLCSKIVGTTHFEDAKAITTRLLHLTRSRRPCEIITVVIRTINVIATRFGCPNPEDAAFEAAHAIRDGAEKSTVPACELLVRALMVPNWEKQAACDYACEVLTTSIRKSALSDPTYEHLLLALSAVDTVRGTKLVVPACVGALQAQSQHLADTACRILSLSSPRMDENDKAIALEALLTCTRSVAVEESIASLSQKRDIRVLSRKTNSPPSSDLPVTPIWTTTHYQPLWFTIVH